LIYQLDIELYKEENELYSKVWEDENCKLKLLNQSFYEKFEIENKANLIYSTNSINWIPIEDSINLSFEDLTSEETKKTSKKTLQILLDNIEDSLLQYGVSAIQCIDLPIDGEGMFEWMTKAIPKVLSKALQEEEYQKMLRLPFLPRIMEDINEEVKSRENQIEWISGSRIKILPIKYNLTREISELLARGIFSTNVWGKLYAYRCNVEDKEVEKYYKLCVKELTQEIMNNGMYDTFNGLFYFVVQKNIKN
jgi:hypothetical protein